MSKIRYYSSLNLDRIQTIVNVKSMFKIPTWYRDQFREWCQEQDIICEYMGTESEQALVPAVDTWYIGRDQDRMLAVLRWS
jgi:hypothetical protein